MFLNNMSKKKKFPCLLLWTTDFFYEFLQKTVFLSNFQKEGYPKELFIIP